jgi:hypothetical protein
MRPIFISICAIGAAAGSYFGQPYMRDNADATLVIITVLTVFAGFLVAIITILGDPSMVPDGSWRAAEVRRDSVEARLIAHTWLFVLYLLAIGFLFIGVLVVKSGDANAVKMWFERVYLFLGIFAFLLTFALPWMLLKLQMSRFEAEIDRRRKAVGIDDGPKAS